MPEVSTGSMGYKNMMTRDVLNDAAFTSQSSKTQNIMGKNPFSLSVRTIPFNSSPEEIVAAVKGAMYRVSDWLLQLDAVDVRRREVLDSDLYDNQSTGYYGGDYAPPDRSEAEVEREREDDDDDDEDDDGTLPPYRSADSDDNMLSGERERHSGDDDDDEDEDDFPDLGPPAFSDDNYDNFERFPHTNTNTNTIQSEFLTMTKSGQRPRSPVPPADRVSVVFRAFVKAQNNKAHWLGSNEKLTRLKFHGGMERVLRLRMSWQQFDAMWNKLDSARSGDLDIEEFRACFGDLENYATLEGTCVLAFCCRIWSILSVCYF